MGAAQFVSGDILMKNSASKPGVGKPNSGNPVKRAPSKPAPSGSGRRKPSQGKRGR